VFPLLAFHFKGQVLYFPCVVQRLPKIRGRYHHFIGTRINHSGAKQRDKVRKQGTMVLDAIPANEVISGFDENTETTAHPIATNVTGRSIANWARCKLWIKVEFDD